MKLLLLAALLLALLGMSRGFPLKKGCARKVLKDLLHQEPLDGSPEGLHHPRGGHGLQRGGHPGQEDPHPLTQILEVNEAVGTFPPGTPPLEFGDIAVDPLGNADQCASDRCRWPSAANGQVLVPFEISPNYSPNERAIITDAVRSFSRSTCITFTPRANQRDYLFIEPQNGCWSFIGRTGGRQVVSLQRNGCVFTGTVQHELLHALGFHHEQNRSDRDDFVTVLLQNVMRGMEHNFRKVRTNNLGTRYDYASIMHYPRDAFSINGRPTLVPKPDPNVPIGTSRQFTATDIAKVNSLYCSRGRNTSILR